MSETAVQDFLSQVSEDQALQSEMREALEAENDREAVTALAKSNGYDFTADELAAEIQKRQADVTKRQAAGELTDEELEAVAGGLTPTVLVVTFGAKIVVTASFTVSAATAKW